jgi:hypothetical protein
VSGVFETFTRRVETRREVKACNSSSRHEIILHMRRNERTSEDRKLQLLKEKLMSIGIKRVPDGRIPDPRDGAQA